MDQPNHTAAEGIEHAALSDIGLRRTNNQDAYAVVLASSDTQRRRRGHLFMVADGMGAHAAGELASKIAVDTVPLTYEKLTDQPPAAALRRAVARANEAIHSRGEANADFHGMGTTASVLALLPEGAVVAHVGDSRVYRLRGQQLDQLSFDHSLAWEVMASGRMRDEDVPSFIPRNVITRSLGPNADVQIDLEGPFPIQVGDTYLLCSDGLSGQVKNEELGAILAALAPEEAARTLVDLANLRGGPDNITVIVVRVTGAGLVRDAGMGDGLGASAGVRFGGSALLLAGAAACALAGAALAAVFVQWVVASALAVIGVATLLAAVLRAKSAPPFDELPDGMLGHGPHSTCHCAPNAQIVTRLSQLVQQLREAATDEDWQIDWNRFDQLRDAAQAAGEKQDYVASVRASCRAISGMMSQVRAQRSRPAGD